MIICYDVTIRNPFDNFTKWRKQIEEHGNDEVVVIMVGCKTDAVKNMDLHQLNTVCALNIIEQKEWKKFNAMHCECSSKTGHNVNGVFLACAELVLKCRKEATGEEGKMDEKDELRRKLDALERANKQLKRQVSEYQEKEKDTNTTHLEAMSNEAQDGYGKKKSGCSC